MGFMHHSFTVTGVTITENGHSYVAGATMTAAMKLCRHRSHAGTNMMMGQTEDKPLRPGL